MIPECQGGEGNFSPMLNDVWSPRIILLNLATGRNAWKSATPHDPTFQAYLRDPMGFLPIVPPFPPRSTRFSSGCLRLTDSNLALCARSDMPLQKSPPFTPTASYLKAAWLAVHENLDIDGASFENTQGEFGPQSPPTQKNSIRIWALIESRTPIPILYLLTSRWTKNHHYLALGITARHTGCTDPPLPPIPTRIPEGWISSTAP